MFQKDRSKMSFIGVGMAVIVFGCLLVGIGIAMWYLNVFSNYSFSVPSSKIMGGTIIGSLGYLILILELMRKK